MKNSVKEKQVKKDDKNLNKGRQPIVQNKRATKRASAITSNNDCEGPGGSSEKTSNVGQGPAGENL